MEKQLTEIYEQGGIGGLIAAVIIGAIFYFAAKANKKGLDDD